MAEAQPRPPMTVELVWNGDLRFTGTTPDNTVLFDSAGKAGVSPVQALVESLGACMGMDLAHFLEKSRVPADKLKLTLVAHRSPEHPRRLLAVDLHADIHGMASDEIVERGIRLSREKYCSVWASLRTDITFTTRFTVHRREPAV